MPARRRKIKNRNREKKSFPLKAISYILLILIPLFLLLYVNITRKYWNGKDKISVAVRNPEGGVDVIIFDPVVEEIVQISIPGNTEVEVAKGLGVWKLGSVWELGKRKDLGELLLTRTLAKHFKFPVFIWADYPASGFSKGRMFDTLKATFLPYSTNLGVGDKISIGFFSLSVKNPKRFEIPLENTGYIKKLTLSDGEEGYIVSGALPQELAVYFVDPNFEENAFRVGIKDGTGVYGLATDMGSILEVMGGKITSIEKVDGPENVNDLGCEVRGRNNVSDKLTAILPCIKVEENPEGNFDIEVSIGRSFITEY